MLAPEYGVKNNFDHAISAARRHQKHPNVERKQLEAGQTEIANLYLSLSHSSASKAWFAKKAERNTRLEKDTQARLSETSRKRKRYIVDQ
jgi:hypothetical protein